MNSSDPALSASLHKNPFWMLWASTRDHSRRIIELADEKALTLDAEDCERARAALTNPRTRLAAELSWLPGISPSRAWQIATAIRGGFTDNLLGAGLPPLARTNALSSAIELLPDGVSSIELAERILALAKSAEEIESDVVFDQVNEDRAVATFPLVKDINIIEEEMAGRWREYKTAVKDLLNRQPTSTILAVMNSVVTQATNGGTCHAPRLIEELVDSYEIEAQVFTEAASNNLQRLVETVQGIGPDEQAIKSKIGSIWKLVDNWNSVVKPIQLISKARGIDHEQSKDFAGKIRALGVHLNNERGMPAIAKNVAETLKNRFSTLPEFAERLGEDVTVLDRLVEEQSAEEQQKKEWENNITYSAEVGVMLKDTLKISPKGVEWKGQLLPLASISQVRWGGTRHSVNGVPTGTTYEIHIANSTSRIVINLRNSETFSSFTERLWRAVGLRLLVEHLNTLKAGESLRFGDAIISDESVVVPRHKFLSNESVCLNWNQVRTWSADGSFFIAAKDDKKVYAALSYSGLYNVHVLERILDLSFKNSKPRLSAVLDA